MSHSDLLKECDRLRSFTDCPLENIDRSLLAKVGFFYNNQNGVVECKFCDLSFSVWREEYRTPLLYHRVYSPLCPIVVHQAYRNVPLVEDDITRVSFDVEDVTICCGPNEEFVTHESRLKSFSNWPVGMQTKPEDLASAGFYYLGQGDIVFCFVCGLKTNQWRVTDDPFEKHIKLSQNCEYLKAVKDRSYIDSVLETEMNKLCELESQNSDSVPRDEQCSVCYQRRRTMVCVPCGHFVMCEPCSDRLTKCPLCGKVFSKKTQAIIL